MSLGGAAADGIVQHDGAGAVASAGAPLLAHRQKPRSLIIIAHQLAAKLDALFRTPTA